MATSTIPAVVATPREGKFNKNAARRVRVSARFPPWFMARAGFGRGAVDPR
jgi:hypothetical protein